MGTLFCSIPPARRECGFSGALPWPALQEMARGWLQVLFCTVKYTSRGKDLHLITCSHIESSSVVSTLGRCLLAAVHSWVFASSNFPGTSHSPVLGCPTPVLREEHQPTAFPCRAEEGSSELCSGADPRCVPVWVLQQEICWDHEHSPWEWAEQCRADSSEC